VRKGAAHKLAIENEHITADVVEVSEFIDIAQRYRVQISRNAAFSKLLLDREVEVPEVVLDRPSAGTWHIRFQRVEDDGYAGPFSTPQEFKLPCRLCYVGGGALLLLLAL